MGQTYNPRMERGKGRLFDRPHPLRIDVAMKRLAHLERVVLVNAKSPVAFFAYPNKPSLLLPPGCEVDRTSGRSCRGRPRCRRASGGSAGRAALASRFGSRWFHIALPMGAITPARPRGRHRRAAAGSGHRGGRVDHLGPRSAAGPRAIRHPHDWLTNPGGAIGTGLPLAVGAAIACPERKVVCLEGDGSAMYTLQALWTMARENLDVTVIIFNNRKYSILELEFGRTGARGGKPGPKAASTLRHRWARPGLCRACARHGRAGGAAPPAEEFNALFANAMAAKGPRLIEVQM